MEATEIGEKIDAAHHHPHHHPAAEPFRRLAAVYVGVVAMLLAIAALGGGATTKEMLNANIHATDTYAFYQAKYIRQIHYQISAEELEVLAAGLTTLPAADVARVGALVKRYRDTAARDESEPATGNGKKELLAKARDWEHRRDDAEARLPNFEYAEAAFQIAIVLGSVAIVALSPWLLGLSGALAAIGVLLTFNGYVLVVPLGHG